MKHAPQRMLIRATFLSLVAVLLTAAAMSAPLLATGLTLVQSPNPLAQQFFDQARQAHAEGDAEKALDLYRKAIETDPQFVESYLRLGELLVALDRFQEAGEVFRKAKDVAPRRGDVRAWLVYVLFKLGDHQRAVVEGWEARSFVTLVDLATVAYYVGLAHDQLGNLEEAVRWLEEAASIEAGGLSGLAQTALIEVYQRILTQRRDPELTLKLSVLLVQRERHPEALTLLQTLTAEAPRLAPAFYWLGLVNIRIGQGFASPDVRRRFFLDARRALERYLELAPNGEFAGEARRLLQGLPSP